MALEVEIKAPCPGAKAKVESIGATFVKSETQEDTYFKHPCRDFKKTDEALRLRNTGDLRITYKGPKQKSDLKARREIEFDVPEEAHELLSFLGFEKAFTIRKNRSTYRLGSLTVSCDMVEGLGEYVEVESASEQDNEKIMAVLQRLGVHGMGTTKSYSELLGL
ncbi:MAG: class IV adenylate cyclase [Candidatus Altiarchaeota archaeon]